MAVDPINAFVLSCVRRARIEQGLRVQDMANRAGIPLGSYSCLETGRYRLRLENLFRILAVLGLEIQKVWPSPKGPVEKVTSNFVRRTVEEAEERRPRQVGYEDILKAICKIYGVSRKQLSSPSRRRDLAEARTVATVLVREQRHLTLVGLSRLLKRDVSSLAHCLRRLKQRLPYDSPLERRISDARSKIQLVSGRKHRHRK